MLLGACAGDEAPIDPPTGSIGSATGGAGTTGSPQGIVVCQDAANQGVELVDLAFELVTGGEGNGDPEAAIANYHLTEFECIKYVANRQAGEPPLRGDYEAQMQACLDTAKFARDASSNMVSLALGKGNDEKHRAEGLANLDGTRRWWPRCFPGEPLPEALEA